VRIVLRNKGRPGGELGVEYQRRADEPWISSSESKNEGGNEGEGDGESMSVSGNEENPLISDKTAVLET
jgi:hypothetical protein